ncbi:molybdenum cofactor guanylyltransferase [Naasia aerilata]|uniref:Molybdenum cofactor guanylyltransferase n=1 Tax=Naasia aerilata TaxID=1162966 RepID=A0ABM8GFX5_9MICO|nr:NTP transferase domain-containing protein [Naasia aerilata]BDZ47252.1 molybdenum cofactor guanylyltransferase [Naasia aerilata]
MRALILAGGRASRLAGRDKTALQYGSRTLLEHAVAAAQAARECVIVGPVSPFPAIRAVLEEPRYGGPVAALAAGLAALTPAEDGDILVLAADQPRVTEAVPALLAAAGGTAAAWVAVDEAGRRQPLLALYREDALRAAVASLGDEVAGASLRRLLAQLPEVAEVPLADRLTADVDTPEDAARAGIPGFGVLSEEGIPRKDHP